MIAPAAHDARQPKGMLAARTASASSMERTAGRVARVLVEACVLGAVAHGIVAAVRAVV